MQTFGFWAFLPTIVVILTALFTKKTFDALVAGCFVGFIILAKTGFLHTFTDSLLKLMQDPTIGWVILVCGLFGSLIHLLIKSGGAKAFAESILVYISNRKTALVTTWLLGLVIFIDDYLNALTVGNSMKKITDSFRIPREMLAYIVDSTAAPICVLIPLSTWAIYISGLLESTGAAESGQGLSLYISIIPYISYGWIAALLVPFVAIGLIPALGAMKKAEIRVAQGGSIAPMHSQFIAEEIFEEPNVKPQSLDFFLPILVLIAATVFFEIDALKGVISAILFTILWQSFYRKQLRYTRCIETAFDGFRSMIYALAIIIMSFVLKDINDQLGLTQLVIDLVSPVLTNQLLPAVVFVSFAIVTFATGSFWGVYAITLPIIIPLATAMDAPLPLAIGSVISAGAFGSHACFYGDSTILSSSASGCNNMAHAISQLPYTLIAGGLTTCVYLLLGFMS